MGDMTNTWRAAVGKRIKEARKAAELTQQQIAERLGNSKQAVSHWELGSWLPEPHLLAPLAKLLGTSTDFLLTGIHNLAPDGSVAKARLPTMVPHPSGEELIEIARGKLVPNKVERRWPTGFDDTDGLLMVLDVADHSMQPLIPHGAKVTIQRGRTPEPGEVVLVALPVDGELLLRRYRPGPSGKPGDLPFTLKSDNPDYGERHITRKDRHVVLGTMVGISMTGSR